MKKLGKLTINPEKVIKNEELINLRGGGYDGYSGAFKKYTCDDGPKVPCKSPSDCAFYETAQDMVDAVIACCINEKATWSDC